MQNLMQADRRNRVALARFRRQLMKLPQQDRARVAAKGFKAARLKAHMRAQAAQGNVSPDITEKPQLSLQAQTPEEIAAAEAAARAEKAKKAQEETAAKRKEKAGQPQKEQGGREVLPGQFY
ncbi:MAG: hypothetical protein J0M13_15890 [Candidatus Accumulibacter sp.]|jgi:hypothetical protein|nr:hypothetical protein [Candidatus Accumulibacter necessarius]